MHSWRKRGSSASCGECRSTLDCPTRASTMPNSWQIALAESSNGISLLSRSGHTGSSRHSCGTGWKTRLTQRNAPRRRRGPRLPSWRTQILFSTADFCAWPWQIGPAKVFNQSMLVVHWHTREQWRFGPKRRQQTSDLVSDCWLPSGERLHVSRVKSFLCTKRQSPWLTKHTICISRVLRENLRLTMPVAAGFAQPNRVTWCRREAPSLLGAPTPKSVSSTQHFHTS
ncbi:hypothetical protein D3C72_1282480 [compost metagenome]